MQVRYMALNKRNNILSIFNTIGKMVEDLDLVGNVVQSCVQGHHVQDAGNVSFIANLILWRK